MKKAFILPLALALIFYLSSCVSSIEMTSARRAHYGEPLGPRAFITGRMVDINGNPVPRGDISHILESPRDSLPEGFKYIAVLARSDSAGRLFGVAIGKIGDNDSIFPGKQLGELRVKLMAYDPASKSLPAYRHIRFEYDSIGNHARFGGMFPYMLDTVFVRKFIHTDIGDVIVPIEGK